MIPVAMVHIYWFILPLATAISLVYSASRYEAWPTIWWSALKYFAWILGLFVLTTALLLLVNTQV